MEHRIRRLERQIASPPLDRDDLERRAHDIAAEFGIDSAELLTSTLDLAERTAGMTVSELARFIAAEEGITVDELEPEAMASAQRDDSPFGGMTP